MSSAELLLSVQLEQAGIPFEREFRFAPPRRWRADFYIGERRSESDPFEVQEADMCPNCVTPWKCNGPHTPQLSPFLEPLLVEIDGGAYVAGRHTRGAGFAADMEKLNAAALLGYRVLRFTPAMVEDGRALAVIRQALGMEVAA